MVGTDGQQLAGVVLAAGFGTRLRPLTDVLPKSLCPVDNEPLVDGAIRRLRAVDAVAGIAVNVHHHRPRMVDHLATHHPDVHRSIEEPEPLGTAGALGQLRPWIDGRPTLLHNADAWHAADLATTMVDGWDGERIRFLTVAAPRGAGDFGDRLYAGVTLLPWRDVEPLQPTPTGLYEVSWRQAELDGRVELVAYEGPWFDTGTPSTYLAANLEASGGESVVAPDADVHPDATVERSVVWAGARVTEHERLVEQVRAPGGITVDAPQPT